MAIRDSDALRRWVNRERPSPEAWRVVWGWLVNELHQRGYAAPSTPLLPASGGQPEVRTALIAKVGVKVAFTYIPTTEVVDLLDVTGST